MSKGAGLGGGAVGIAYAAYKGFQLAVLSNSNSAAPAAQAPNLKAPAAVSTNPFMADQPVSPIATQHVSEQEFSPK